MSQKAPQHVLTAAHCAEAGLSFEVMLGAHNVRADSEEGRIEITTFDAVVYPDWERPLSRI